MANKITNQPDLEFEKTITQILNTGYLSYQEHFHLTTLCLADLNVTDHQRQEINRVFDLLQTGRIKLRLLTPSRGKG